MPTIRDTAATSALNEKEYINKIYDSTNKSQKDVIQEGYDSSIQQLDTGKTGTQKLTDAYVNRTNVEAGKIAEGHKSTGSGTGGSIGANAQASLSLGNQQQANITALNQQQTAADVEFERQRKILADRYASMIKQAQADNDMNRAQALYEAARAEEEQLRALRQQGASLLGQKGDNSIYDAIANGTPVSVDITTPTWDAVTKNEADINKIYDAQIKSQRIAAQMQRDEELSDIDAKQAEAMRTTDKNLTNAYVDSLKKSKNYMETQNAYGQGSGTAKQAQLARDNELTEKLTSLRTLQTGQTADREVQRLDLARAYADAIAKAQASGDTARVKALYEAAEKEEQNLVEDQQFVGQQYAENNDYSILGKLYGLTQDQIDRIQGTGKYARRGSGGNGRPNPKDGKSTPIFDGSGTVNNAVLRQENLLEKQAASKYRRG